MNKTLFIQAYIDQVWNRKNSEVVEDFIHPEYKIVLDPDNPWEKKTLNHVEFKKRLSHAFRSFPGVHYEIKQIIEDVNHAAVFWELTATHLDGKKRETSQDNLIQADGVTIYYFEDNKICGHAQLYDRLKITRQLGF